MKTPSLELVLLVAGVLSVGCVKAGSSDDSTAMAPRTCAFDVAVVGGGPAGIGAAHRGIDPREVSLEDARQQLRALGAIVPCDCRDSGSGEIGGVFPLLCTPYAEDGSLDCATLAKEASFVADCGADGKPCTKLVELK